MSFRTTVMTSVLVMFMVSGCSHWPTPVATWKEGEGSADLAAVLTVPGHLQLLQVDGRKIPGFLAQSTAFDYLLLPGERTLTVRYDSLWAGGLGGRAERVISKPHHLQLNVEPGQQYRLDSTAEPASVSAARAFALCPGLWLKNSAGERLLRAQPEVPCHATD